MWRCVDLALTDVSEERRLTQVHRHIPEDDILHSHRCESLKSYYKNEFTYPVEENNLMYGGFLL
jgi:hypothetical protein